MKYLTFLGALPFTLALYVMNNTVPAKVPGPLAAVTVLCFLLGGVSVLVALGATVADLSRSVQLATDVKAKDREIARLRQQLRAPR